MVKQQLRTRGITDPRVLRAMLKVKRHLFVPANVRHLAYEDGPLPIGEGQTISQPYIVALMTELGAIQDGDKVLEIGTGSGYQAAILAEMGARVYTIEIIEELAASAKRRLWGLGYRNIHLRQGDGYQGWPQEAPFDVIIVTAASKELPEKLIEQLKSTGRMVIPLGDFFQNLYVITKDEGGQIQKEHIIPVRFVPMVHGDRNQ